MKNGICFSIATLLLVSAPGARQDRWTVIGPGGGGAQFLPTISPHDPRRVLVACDMTGSYLSNDAGASWRMFNLRDRARWFAFDPNDSKIIYAGANGLYRSTDEGKTWNLVYPAPKTFQGFRMSDDHAGCELLHTGTPSGRPAAFAIAAGDSKHLYAGFSGGKAPGLYESGDAGVTWSKLSDLPGPAQHIVAGAHEVYATGPDFVLTCRAGHCGSVKTPARFLDSYAALQTIYGISAHDVFVSRDSGATWAKSRLPGDNANLRAVAASAGHPERAYVSYSGLRENSEKWFGVAKTIDAGATWELVWKEGSTPAANIHDSWISARFGTGWGENPLNLGVSPTDPNIVYGTDFGRTMRSTNGGRNWTAMYSLRTPDGAFATNGMDVTTCYGVHFDPFDQSRMFISYTDIGLFVSRTAGKSWMSATEKGVPHAWVNTTYWVEFDPETRGRMWAVMSGTHDLPRPKMWRQASVQSYQGGVVASDDGGATWRVSNGGMDPTAPTHILIDPKSPKKARVLYVAAFGKGVYKSSDGGTTWTLKNDGLPGPEPFAWRLALDRDGAIYVILARRTEDGSAGKGDGKVFRSTDGAAHWKEVSLPEGVNGPNGLAIDPRNAAHVYLAAWGRKTADGAVDGGVYASDNAGRTWRHVLDRDQHIYDVTIDPRDPDVVYACGFESSAWRSIDKGASWNRIRGYNFKWGHRVIPDPADHSKIYITTFGGSVWHGPATGDPAAQEDIATPQIAYSR